MSNAQVVLRKPNAHNTSGQSQRLQKQRMLLSHQELCQLACRWLRDPLSTPVNFLLFHDLTVRNYTFCDSHAIRTALEFLGDRAIYSFLGRAVMKALPEHVELYLPIIGAIGSNVVLGEFSSTLKMHTKTADKTGGDVFETIQGASLVDDLDDWDAVEARAVEMFTPLIMVCASALLDAKRLASSSNTQPLKRARLGNDTSVVTRDGLSASVPKPFPSNTSPPSTTTTSLHTTPDATASLSRMLAFLSMTTTKSTPPTTRPALSKPKKTVIEATQRCTAINVRHGPPSRYGVKVGASSACGFSSSELRFTPNAHSLSPVSESDNPEFPPELVLSPSSGACMYDPVCPSSHRRAGARGGVCPPRRITPHPNESSTSATLTPHELLEWIGAEYYDSGASMGGRLWHVDFSRECGGGLGTGKARERGVWSESESEWEKPVRERESQFAVHIKIEVEGLDEPGMTRVGYDFERGQLKPRPRAQSSQSPREARQS
ncbi:hypothetical protein B0H16DRAFT_1797271 [Mycena metata]|uniref:RNase III domain-containing protein n=1 Tax=Mycena metata TaxID=1033252 RepID=A0AAD7MI25_9AGAR|nr:hypothetical protein B0H16DRAFT_1797271 [Mycena metata]